MINGRIIIDVKIDGCQSNLESWSTTKVGEHILSAFSMSAISTFKSIENKHNVYVGKDCMKKFCELLREHTMGISNFKKMMSLTNKQRKSKMKWKSLLYL